MMKGYLNQVRKGVQSTPALTDDDSYTHDSPRHNHETTNCLFASIMDLGGTIYAEQTGQFPRVSSRGIQYIMV